MAGIFLPCRKSTLLIPSGPEDDPDRKHWHVLMTDPQPGNGELLLVCACSVIIGRWHDPSCVLTPADHAFFNRNSFIAYHHAALEPAASVLSKVNKRLYIPQAPITEAVYQRIATGLLQSKHANPAIKNFLQNAK